MTHISASKLTIIGSDNKGSPLLFPQTGFTEGICEPAVSFNEDIHLPLRQDTSGTQEAQDVF